MLIDFSSRRIPSRPKVKMSGGKPVLFKPGDVKGVMLHQSACYFDNGSRSQEWLARRALRVACHIVVYRSGLVAVAAPLDWVMHHGNEPNTFSWGIEVEGMYSGTPGIRSSQEKPLNDATREGLREALNYLTKQAFEREHYDFGRLWAHRQSSENRPHDPGYEIWSEALTTVGGTYYPEPNKVWGTGQTIPKAWDRRQD